MNKKITKLIAALALLAFLIPPVVGWGQTRDEEVYSTCLFGSSYNSQSVGNYTATWSATNGDFTWTIVNGNNNNNGWSFVKFGRKNNASVGSITTAGDNNAGCYSEAITKVVVTIDAITATSINSIKLYTSSDNSSWTEAGSFTKETGAQSVSLSSPTANLYYKVEFDCASGSSNGLVTVSKVEYYHESGSSTAVATPVISGETSFLTSTEVTITCSTEGAAIQYSIDNGTSWSTYSEPFTLTETTTVTAKATKSGLDDSQTTSKTFTKVTPMTVAQAIEALDESSPISGAYVQGIVSQVDSYNPSYNSITYWISDDGTTTSSQLEVYSGKGLNGAGFASIDDIEVGASVVISGTLKIYNSTIYEFDANSQLMSYTAPAVTTCANPTFSPAAGTYTSAQSVEIICTTEGATIYYTTDGSDPTTSSSVYSAAITVNSDMTIKAIAVKEGLTNSEIVSAEYVIDLTPVINADDINIAYDATSGEIAYTITNPATGVSLGASSTAEWISEITVGDESVTFTCTANEDTADREATITLSYTGAAEKTVTVTQGHYVVDFATLPFEWEGGSSATFNALTGVTTSGLGSDYSDSHNPYYIKFDSDNDYIQVKTDKQPGKVTIGVKMIGGTNTSYITVQGSADGETFTEVQTLTISGNSTSTTLNLETTNAFAATDRYVRLVFTKGSNVGVGPITIAKVSTDPSITLNTYAVEATAAETEGTLDITYANLEISDMSDFGIQFYDANEEELSGDDEPDWIEVTVAEQDPQVGEGYVVSYVVGANTGEARTAYFKVFALGDEDYVYSNLVTVTQAAYVAPFQSFTCTLATSIVSGKHYIITNGSTKAMGYDKGNNRGTADITLTGNVATVSSTDVYEFVIIGPVVDGLYTIYDVTGETGGYLYAASSGSNYLKTQSNINDNARWSITFDATEGFASIVATESSNRNVMQYNSSSALFACYASASQANVYLYAKDNESTATYDLSITGYGDNAGGYRLIAAPVGSAMNLSDNGFLTDDYDLYYFDQNENSAEWRNYKDQATGGWDIVSGRGYLYASKTDADLHFVGYPYVGNGQVVLSYTEDNTFAGWNLIGNPFATAATLDSAYYRLNSDGSELKAETESGSVAAMEGVFVKATKAGFAKFTATATQNAVPQLNVNLATSNRGSSTLDRAIIRFDEGSQLPKFMLNEANAKLYIPQGTKDYAVVRSNNEGSMPVNFKAATDGTYTLSIEAENVEMDYLHLIDNLTGADIDLIPLLRGQGGLNEPATYTFQARTSDYASRFRLVFSANDVNENVTSSETFAYFNGSEWVVNASEKATLQVIDVMGRVLSNETVSGSHAMSLNLGTGVYMLRLVNGNDVKVQKIVVR